MSEPLIAISKKHAFIFASFLVAYEFLTYIANDMIMPGMIHVVHSFNAQESLIATSLTLYILGGASLQLFLGPLSDAYGRRPMMLVGSCLFFVFTVAIACSQSMHQFLIARFFEGTGLCFIGVIGYATIQEIFEEMDAIRLISIMANVSILAPLLGPLLGAIVIHYTSWRYIFIAIACFALIVLWGLSRYMPEPIGAVKKNGEVIPKHEFSFRKIISNYFSLLQNKTFCSAVLAIAAVGVPCVAWIGLAPVILIVEAKLTVIQYALWQIPIFGATIMGNWCLHHLTYKLNTRQIVHCGGIIMFASALLLSGLPYLFGNNYYCLLPGIIVYFFSLSIINAPLNRICLYATSVSKGTASAIISLSVMILGAAGTELANHFYQGHKNLYFGLYCNGVQLFYFICLFAAFYFQSNFKKIKN